MSEEELLLGCVFSAPVGLGRDSGPRRLLGKDGPRMGPRPSPLVILGRSPQHSMSFYFGERTTVDLDDNKKIILNVSH